MLHHYSDVLGYLDLNAVAPVDLVLKDSVFSVGCLNCNKEDTIQVWWRFTGDDNWQYILHIYYDLTHYFDSPTIWNCQITTSHQQYVFLEDFKNGKAYDIIVNCSLSLFFSFLFFSRIWHMGKTGSKTANIVIPNSAFLWRRPVSSSFSKSPEIRQVWTLSYILTDYVQFLFLVHWCPRVSLAVRDYLPPAPGLPLKLSEVKSGQMRTGDPWYNKGCCCNYMLV